MLKLVVSNLSVPHPTRDPHVCDVLEPAPDPRPAKVI